MLAARDVDYRAAVEEGGDRRVSSVADVTTMRRSSRARQRLFRQRDREIAVHAALVKFVEDDRVEVGEERIGLQARG